MDFFEVIEKRHCCRNFDPKRKIGDEILNKILQTGKKAPSAGGFYPVNFKVIKNQKLKNGVV